jgi:hypothetical protein
MQELTQNVLEAFELVRKQSFVDTTSHINKVIEAITALEKEPN